MEAIRGRRFQPGPYLTLQDGQLYVAQSLEYWFRDRTEYAIFYDDRNPAEFVPARVDREEERRRRPGGSVDA